MLTIGWTYFYQLILAYLFYFKNSLLNQDETGILSMLSCQNYKFNEINWLKLIRRAESINIDKIFISKLLIDFDEENFNFLKKNTNFF